MNTTNQNPEVATGNQVGDTSENCHLCIFVDQELREGGETPYTAWKLARSRGLECTCGHRQEVLYDEDQEAGIFPDISV